MQSENILSPYQSFIHISRYSRWLPELKRRETWPETVQRYVDFFVQERGDRDPELVEVMTKEIGPAIEQMKVMPSMRVLMTAGEALRRSNVAAFNCSYLAINTKRSFSEALYILLAGTGVGFSCERQEVNKLPLVPEVIELSDDLIVVEDSKEGWAKAYAKLINYLYQGDVPKISYDKVRPAGARLRTFGGRACLTGDTLVYKDRKKSQDYNEVTIRQLYEMKNRLGKLAHIATHFSDIKLRSLDEKTGEFYRNQLLDVIHNGVAPVYKVTTESGYSIRATGNHRFMDALGEYKFVSQFSVGEPIAVNGSTEPKTGECLACGVAVSRRAIKCRGCVNLSQLKTDCLETTARQRKECRSYKEGREECERCCSKGPRLTTHHKDKDPHNNAHSNLELLCEPCHQKHHAKENTFGNPYSHKYVSFDAIVSIVFVGNEEVYDLSMQAPDHNFVANGFVSHNSGPGPLKHLFEYTISQFMKAKGRKLNSLEVHDLMCVVGEIVVVGGVRRCLPGTSIVQTTAGLKSMSSLAVGDYVVTSGKPHRVIAAESTGVKSMISLTHQSGVLTCTPEHRVAVFTSIGGYEFKAASEIKVDDRLVFDTQGYDGCETKALPAFTEKVHFNSKPFSIPDLDENVAWLFGYLHGNGHCSPKGLEFTHHSEDTDPLENAKWVLETYFGLSGDIGPDSKGGLCSRLRVNSSGLSRWFQQHFKQSNAIITIPEQITSASRGIRSAYLAGLFDADGRSKADGGCEQVTTVYEPFYKQVVSLLASLGIGSSVYAGSAELRRAAGRNAQDFWSVSVPTATHKARWVATVAPSSVSRKVSGITHETGCRDLSYPVSMFNPRPQGYKPWGSVSLKSLGLGSEPLVPSKVLSIEEAGSVETFDIEVEDVAQFTTDGLVVHNSALISLSNLSDQRMRDAKSGNWWVDQPQRALANNSVAYTEKPEASVFMEEWLSLVKSKSGERGIFNRVAAQKQASKYGRRSSTDTYGCNPCSEIILRDKQFCNLSEIVIRAEDTKESIRAKARIATIIGTVQATLTDFKFLGETWKKNTEEEALLGVSMTGIMDNKFMAGLEDREELARFLNELREYCSEVNNEWAEKLGINPSAAVTCVKPSGTVSQLTNTASGIHARHNTNYVRTVRLDKKDPVYKLLSKHSFPMEDEVTRPDNTAVASFAMTAPAGAVTRGDMTALEQLDIWLLYQHNWCDHKPSVTVSVGDDEWMEVGAWVWKYFNEVSGISFLPRSDHTYQQAPYQDMTEEGLAAWVADNPTPEIDWKDLAEFEIDDETTGVQQLACVSGVCEI